MKLTELSPKWFAEAGRTGQGVTFLCPHCLNTRLAVAFANPVDGGAVHPLLKYDVLARSLASTHSEEESHDIVPPGYHWTRTGEDFATLSLSPSVDASKSGHWHGHVIGGEIR